MHANAVKPVWGRGAKKPSRSVREFIEAHPVCKTDPKLAPYVSVAQFATSMLEVNSVPAMFREYNQAFKNLTKALGIEEQEDSLASLIGGSDVPTAVLRSWIMV